MQTQQDVRRDPQRLQQPWTNSLANFYRDNPSAGTVRAEASARAEYTQRLPKVRTAAVHTSRPPQRSARATVPVDAIVRTPVYLTSN